MNKKNEKVLVLKTEDVFKQETWRGINAAQASRINRLALTKGKFRKRGKVETDASFKQIIPYIIFQHQGKLLIMQRTDDLSEQRLASQYSLGIGGHLRQEDLHAGDDILAWSRREFEEEVDYQGNLDMKTLGVLYDDSRPVDEVHLGLVILARGDSPQIKVKNEHQSGQLLTLKEALKLYDQMEVWSQIVINHLQRLQPNR